MKKQNVVMVVVAVILCAICIAIDFAFYPPQTNELTDQEVAEMYYENDYSYDIEGEYEVVIGHSAEMPQGNTLTNVWAYNAEGEVVAIATVDLNHYRSVYSD